MMDWMEPLNEILQTLFFSVVTMLGIFLATWISVKLNSIKQQSSDSLHQKYIGMLDKTIVDCVLSTTQTYVEALKKQGKFDEDAQKIALETTYNNVMLILTEDAKEYLQIAIGDFNTYVLNKIEAEVNKSK